MKSLQICDAIGWWAYARAVNLRRIKTRHSGPWIMGRIGCLGLDVLKLLEWKYPLVNTQKGRADCLLEYARDSALRPHTAALPHHYERRDILHLVAQQEIFRWPRHNPPKVVIMDSYSELTDQLFVHRRNKWFFCSNYQDLRQGADFAGHFECKGLIPLDQLAKVYEQFFANLIRDIGHIPILFLHFPTDLDSREKFKVRHNAIQSAIHSLSKTHLNLHSIHTDPGIVSWPENPPENTKNFPYHYNKATYLNLAEKINLLGLEIHTTVAPNQRT